MIQAEGLCLAFGGQILLDQAAFTMQKGERCALIGRNGAGKSTLFRLITKKENLDKGSISLPRGYRIGMLAQQISFTEPTVLQEAALGLREEEKECLYKVEALLLGLGFSMDQLDASPHVFSGGYQLRIQLAKVLVSEPDCLLLDEPTNYLDILSIRFLSRFLQQWKKEMILISHDLQFLDATTTHMMSLHRNKIFKIKGKSQDIFSLIAEEEERHEHERIGQEKKKAHLQSFIDRFGAKATKAGQARSKQKMIDKMPVLEKLKDLYNLGFLFHEVPFYGRKMLEASQVEFSYDKIKPIVKDCSLTVEKGDRIAIIGKNGYGKSTLLRLLSSELKPDKGMMTLSDSCKIGYFGQTSIERLDPKLRIEEEIASANPNLNFTQIRGICGLMMFSGDLAKKSISVLSGGEKSRVLLGKIVARPCNLLLLDEPTHHLDVESIEALLAAIEEFDGSVIIVTHSEWVLRRMALNKLIVCHKDKQEIFLGNYDEFLEKLGWPEEEVQEKKKASAKISPNAKPLKSKIKTIEDKIMAIEVSIEKHNEKLATLSQTGKGDEIKELVSLMEKEQKILNDLYQELGELYSQT